ncbi:hypothetical protein [Moorena sp. SIO3H5]|uniref:hypothetical protein n=1 Tax=Moorena sp. SIO3H5 TaxID=2607834 RepID=UPI0013B968E3|nr:hypothetical protein [Moorena sp. SIO3H5]NEO71053.1 hypothetical protein [Moorena sp. SIO3H5]
METIELTQELIQSKWAELSKSSMEVLAANAGTTEFKVLDIQATQITVSYNTLLGNQPNTYGNYIALWQNDGSIPWDSPTLKTQKIDTNTPNGTMTFSGLELTIQDYIVGYAVSPELSGGSRQKQGNICSSANILKSDGGSSQREIFTPSICTSYIGPNSIAINYNLPTGILPKTNGAWIGLWESALPSYNNPPIAANNLREDAASGAGFINNLKLLRGRTYTVALFMSGWDCDCNSKHDQKSMACYVTFTV